MSLLMISCKKATELIEKKISFTLSFAEKIQLDVHTRICIHCLRYEKQSVFIETLLQHQHLHPELAPSISDEKALEITTKILLKKNL